MDRADPAPSFLGGGGEAGARIRAFNWESTPLGDPQHWPQSLKTIVRVMLDSRYAMWMLWGPELTFFCNDAYLPTVGLKRDWVMGARSDRVWEEIWPDIGPRIQQVLTRGEATWDEALQLFLERSGFPEETYHTFSYSPVYDDDSRIAGMLCVVTEVTDRVIRERQLRVLRDLAAQSVTGDSVAETCRRVCTVLARYPLDVAFAGLYLLENSASATRAAQTHSPPDAALPTRIALYEALSPWPINQLVSSEETQEVRDLPSKGIAVVAGPWPDLVHSALILPLKGSGTLPLTGFLIAGVSPRRALDEDYRAFLQLIATQIAAAIAGAQAYASERRRAEELAEIDRAKTEFFSNVSHEFRTPLTLMLGPLEQALTLPPQELARHRDDLEVAHRNALRLLRLVNTLLDFSRLEAGRIQASFAPVDVPTLTRDLASVFRSAIERAGLRFVVDCEPLPQQPWVDADLWEKIVLNLLSNAFKYTSAGQITLHLSGTQEQIELRVADTGIGIPAEAQAHLFERFYRVPGAQGRTHEGTGIGLSLVSELVQLHGGSIRVESQVGAGTTFVIRFPAGNAHLPPERLELHPADAQVSAAARTYAEEARRWLSPEAVEVPREDASHALIQTAPLAESASPLLLLADDNADMRAYIARLLTPLYRVLTAVDGVQALELLHRHHPELLLTDVMMPRLDGYGLLRAVRSDPALREMPVIMLSARAGENARIEGLDAEADDYVVKPFVARELLARVSNQISMSRLRREARDAVTASEGRFRAALSSSMIGFVVMQAVRDPDGHVIDFEWRYVNPAAERLLEGSSAQQLLGRRLRQSVPESWVPQPLFDTMVRVVEHCTPEDIEISVERDGQRFWFQNSIAKTEDGVVVWFADISARKRVESELREVDRRKDEFLAILAHELRNPLAPIRQAAAIASSPRRTEAQLRWSQGVIERQVRHMARLLDDLLDVSRITRGTLELRREQLDIRSVVEAAVETSQPALEAKAHTLNVQLPEVLPMIEGDGLRLAQVLSNLLTNAAKYTDAHGHIDLTVSEEGAHLVFRVADNGIGIAADALPRMFQMFSQLRPALERSEGGLGIGLALVKGLVALHGGAVEVASPGTDRGSEFIVRLPLVRPHPRSDPDSGVPQARLEPVARRRILVVDDNPDAVESLALLLALDGHEVRTAVDPDTALTIAATFRPELAILDIGLPRRNGYELARDLINGGAQRPFLIALTGWGQIEDRQRAREAGFDEHLTKPVDPETVRALARRAISA
jgi:PAS domain S-box-containing protein